MKAIAKNVSVWALLACVGVVAPVIGQVVTCGPSGGTGGSEFVDDAIPPSSRVIEVRIWAGDYIDALQIVLETSAGARHELPKHGGSGGRLQVFTLDAGEYITGISGRFGSYVDSIRIHTNLQNTRLYGGGGGAADYNYQAPPGTEVVGFSGRAGDYIDAVGVTLRRR